MFLKYAHITVFLSKYAIFRRENVRKWTLLGGKSQGGWIGSTVIMKGTPVSDLSQDESRGCGK